MKKLAIIGASYLQLPLIRRAKEMGYKTIVFAWECGDVGEKEADVFYPISIVEKERILEEIDGICSIASDLASITVGYIANKMGLVGNSPQCIEKSTNKHLMRHCFEENGDPSPKSIYVHSVEDLKDVALRYPLIVKPVDRSGSRGITKIYHEEELNSAIKSAISQGFDKAALVEEFAEGDEYSVEYISYKGKHSFLALTQKFTTGAPHFIETGHLEPAPVDTDTLDRIKQVIEHALDSLCVEYGASHSEIKIDNKGEIKIIEIGARMGGDMIGSSLVKLSTGVDFVGDVIRVSVGEAPLIERDSRNVKVAIRFVMSESDLDELNKLKETEPSCILEENVNPVTDEVVTDSSNRFGYYILLVR